MLGGDVDVIHEPWVLYCAQKSRKMATESRLTLASGKGEKSRKEATKSRLTLANEEEQDEE